MTEVNGMLPVLPTPLASGSIDGASISTLVSFVAPYSDGITVLGSSGESGYFSATERRKALAFFAEAAADHDLRLIAGVVDPSLDEARAFVSSPEAESVDAFLVLPPTYYPATLDATERHVAEIAAATERPIVFYDIPSLSGLNVSPQELLALARGIPSIRFIKVASPDIERVRELSEGELALFAGYDEVLHEQVCEGCSGAMVPVVAMAPAASRRYFDAAEDGRRDEAFAIYTDELAPLIRAMVGPDVDFIAVVKRYLRQHGVLASEETVPGLPGLSPARERQVDEAIAYVERSVR
jgi:4-hydroxy-tetrahydrodipicolinate synthase